MTVKLGLVLDVANWLLWFLARACRAPIISDDKKSFLALLLLLRASYEYEYCTWYRYGCTAMHLSTSSRRVDHHRDDDDDDSRWILLEIASLHWPDARMHAASFSSACQTPRFGKKNVDGLVDG